MKRTAVAAPAPRPSDEEMLEAIAKLTVGELVRITRTLYGLIELDKIRRRMGL